jgi:type IX secretion system substrate protein
VQVFPNPVTDGAVNITLSNLKPGKYFLKLFNSAGKLIETKPVDINDENRIQTVSLPAPPKGLYYIQLGENDLKINKTIMVQ